MVSSREAAERLGISVAYFHRLAEARAIEPAVPASRHGTGKLWHPGDIEELVLERGARA